MNEIMLITLTLILVGGIVCQLIAYHLKLPAILFLLLMGFVSGPVTGIFDPDQVFGDLLFPIVSLGVAIILFEGALTLQFEEIKNKSSVIWRLCSIGALSSLVVGTYAAHKFVGVDLKIALVFGAIVTVTGPTVIMPILRAVRPKPAVSNVLRWEGIVIDPIGAILAVLVFEFMISKDSTEVWVTFGKLILSGGVMGAIFAAFLAFILRQRILPDYLMKITILAYVVGVYTLCDLVQHESGLLAVTIMGIVLANTKGIFLEEILDFKESLSIIIISGLFIVLSARMNMDTLLQAGTGSIFVLLALMFVARPIGVVLSTIGSPLSWRERALISWISPRGIIAAAIAPLFVLKLESKGIPNADMLSSLVFVVIIGTVVFQSFTSKFVAKLLGVAEPEAKGVLIIGAGTLARAIAHALQKNGFNTLLADTNWDSVRTARMEGLKTFFGNVVSEHADRAMDLMGIGKLLAISKRPTVNALACMRYRRDFGAQNVFIIKTAEEQAAREKDEIAHEYTAPFLFGGSVTQTQLTSLIENGHEIRATPLTDEFTYAHFMDQYKGDTLPLFAINKRGGLVPYIDKADMRPDAGWVILSLLPLQGGAK